MNKYPQLFPSNSYLIRSFIILLLSFLAIGVFAQKNMDNGKIDSTKKEEKVFIQIETMPSFIGGELKMYQYIAKNKKYPEEAKKQRISGSVLVTFVVEKDGSISNVEVDEGIGGGCDEEAIRVIESMPKWTPGTQKGNKPLRLKFRMPIDFQYTMDIVDRKRDRQNKKTLKKLIKQIDKQLGVGDYKNVLQLVDSAIAIDSINPSLYYTKGVSLESTNKNDNAIIAYEKALVNYPKYEDALFNIGILHLKRANDNNPEIDSLSIDAQNDYSMAIIYLESYLEINPKDEEIKPFVEYAKQVLERTDKILSFSNAKGNIYLNCDSMPKFPGGDQKMYEFISQNINYPRSAMEQLISGEVLFTFIIETHGTISNIKIIKGIGAGCDEEVMRVVSKMPKWTPGMHNGQFVRVRNQLPIRFNLQ